MSHKDNGEPVYEVQKNAIHDNMEFERYLKYLPYQGFVSVKVEDVVEEKGKFETDKYEKNSNSKLAGEYQDKINKVLKPKVEEEKPDYKAKYEELSERMAKLEEEKERKKPGPKPKEEKP